MKRYFYTLLTTLMAVMTTMAIVSCSDDDDDSGMARINSSYLKCPDDHHPHIVDLGLPSGTKWACCNVGANTPETKGGYYAWGETEEKPMYNQVTYLYCTGVDEDEDGWYDDYHDSTNTNGVWQDLGSDISGTKYDVAHMKWGGSWVMPSQSQITELQKKCTYTWTSMNGVDGGLFKGPNGGVIFLPVAGECWGDYFDRVDSVGCYWSGTYNPSYSYDASCLFLCTDYAGWIRSTTGRSSGRTVRPVWVP